MWSELCRTVQGLLRSSSSIRWRVVELVPAREYVYSKFLSSSRRQFGETQKLYKLWDHSNAWSPLCLHILSDTDGRVGGAGVSHGVSFIKNQASWLPYVRTCARGQKRDAGFDFSFQGLSNWENKSHVQVRQGHQQNKIAMMGDIES